MLIFLLVSMHHEYPRQIYEILNSPQFCFIVTVKDSQIIVPPLLENIYL